MKVKLLILMLLWASLVFAQDSYLSYDNYTQKLRELSAKSNVASVKSIGKSASGKDIWAFTLSSGNDKKPALLVTAGIDGMHQAGTLITVKIIEKMMADNAALSKQLEKNTLYFVPSVSPDAMAAYFARVKYERSGNATPTDDDRNGRVGDDPYEDLNGDGFITQVRIENAAGTHVVSEADDRLLVKADASKGQVGKYIVISEGTDQNKNGVFNEDASEGVNIDKNFAYDYAFMSKSAGIYAASEKETKALMDFVFANPNIHSVVTFGPANNLTEPMKYDAKQAKERIIKTWLENDAKVSAMVSKLYNDKTALKDAPKLPMTAGNFAQTAYFHAGKFSYSTPGWWAPKVENTADSASAKSKKGAEDSDLAATYLKWADSEGLNDVFVAWADVNHPDFPGQKAQVGGIKPYALFNPPAKYLDESAEKHHAFLTGILASMPAIEIANPKVEKVQGDMYRVTVQVINKGFMPTYTEIGDKIQLTPRMKTELVLGANQSRISGKKIDLGDAMQPNESREYSWLVSGKGKVTVKVGCASAGEKEVTLDLK